MNLGERTRRTLGHLLYPIAHTILRIDSYISGTEEDRGLRETFLGDVARSIYSTLNRCGIMDPRMVRILDEVRRKKADLGDTNYQEPLL